MAPVPAVDYAFNNPSIKSLASAGFKSAGRYVGPGSADKHLTAVERDELFAAGISVFLLVEGQIDSALEGARLGAIHGAQGETGARALGAPAGSVLIAAIDFDVTAAQWPACRAYMTAFGSAVRAAGYRVGLYAGLNGITWGARDRVASIFFQTYAWSRRNGVIVWSPAAQIQQYQNGVGFGGGVVDLCRTMTADFGQWPAAGQTAGADMIFVKCDENGGFYAYGLGDPKWYLSIPSWENARSATGAPSVTVGTIDDIRRSFGYVPGSAADVAAGRADVVTDPFGNVLPAVAGGTPALVPHIHAVPTASPTGPAVPSA